MMDTHVFTFYPHADNNRTMMMMLMMMTMMTNDDEDDDDARCTGERSKREEKQ